MNFASLYILPKYSYSLVSGCLLILRSVVLIDLTETILSCRKDLSGLTR
jgi:hypothetical protein